MMTCELVTGSFGTEHVSSADAGSMYASVFGPGRYSVKQGNGLAATLVTSNSVQVGTGALFMDGRYFRVTAAETLTIDSGGQGVNRIDLIGVHYTYNNGTGVESATLQVVKGSAVAGTPSAPTYTDGDINAGATEAFFPLYSITLTGISVADPVKLFYEMPGTVSCPWPVGSVLQMTNATDPNNVYPGTTWSKIQGAFLLGSSNSHALGTTGGAESVTLTESQLPSHSHTYYKANATSGSTALTVDQIPSHTHTFNRGNGTGTSSGKYVVAWGNTPLGLSPYSSGTGKNDANEPTGGGQGHTHSVGTTSTNSGTVGSGSAVSTMPPYKVVNMWERTA